MLIHTIFVYLYLTNFSEEKIKANKVLKEQVDLSSLFLEQNGNETGFMQENRELFYKHCRERGLSDVEIDDYYSKLLMDNVFQDGLLQLNSFRILDIDQNG